MKKYTWNEYYDKYYDWAESTQMKYASGLTSFGATDEICEIVIDMSCNDEKCASQLLEKALEAGVRFSPEQVVELSGAIEQHALSKMAMRTEKVFDRAQLEEIDGFLDDDAFAYISKRAGIDIYEDEEPDDDIWQEPPAKKPGFFATLFAVNALDSFLSGKNPGFFGPLLGIAALDAVLTDNKPQRRNGRRKQSKKARGRH